MVQRISSAICSGVGLDVFDICPLQVLNLIILEFVSWSTPNGINSIKNGTKEMLFGKTLRHTLLAAGKVIAARYDANLKLIGTRCAADRTFFQRLEAGEGLTIRKAEEALAWLSFHWPPDRVWPKTFFERPTAKDARDVVFGLPEDRRIVLIPRGRTARNSNSSPTPESSRAAKPAPAPAALPPFAGSVGASLQREEHQG